jgi:tetratricopeptide (TPR) repeat protein
VFFALAIVMTGLAIYGILTASDLSRNIKKLEADRRDFEKERDQSAAKRFLLAAQLLSYDPTATDLALLLISKAFGLDRDLTRSLPPKQARNLNRLRPERPQIVFFRTQYSQKITSDFDCKHLAEITAKGVYILDVQSGEEKHLQIEGNGSTTTLAFRRDGQRLITGTAKGELLFWDVKTAGRDIEPMPREKTPRLESPIQAVAFNNSVQAALCAAASQDGRAILWHEETGDIESQFKADDNQHFTALVFHINPKKPWIATISTVGKTQVWDTSNGKPLLSLPDEDTGWAVGVSFDNVDTSNRIATISVTGTVAVSEIVHAPDGKYLPRLVFKFETGQSPFAGGVRFSPDGKQLITWHGNETVAIYDASNGRQMDVAAQPWPGYITAFALSPNGKQFAISYSAQYESTSSIAVRAASLVGQVTVQPPPYLYSAHLLVYSGPVIAVYHTSEHRPLLDRLLESASTVRHIITTDEYLQILSYVASEKVADLQNWVPANVDEKSAADNVELIRKALGIPGFKEDAEVEARRLVAEALVNRSVELLKKNEQDKAEACTRMAKELLPGLEIDPKKGTQQLLLNARAMAGQKKLPEALATLDQAAKADPELNADDLKKEARLLVAESYRNDGNSQAVAGKYADALKSFQSAATLQADAGVEPEKRIDPKKEADRFSATYHQNQARSWAYNFKLEEATREMNEALRLNPDLSTSTAPAIARRLVADARRGVARSRAVVGNVEEAELEFRRAFEVDGDPKIDPHKEALRLAAPWAAEQARAAANRLDIDAARALIRQAHEYDPSLKSPVDDVVRSSWSRKVQILAIAGEIPEAVKSMEEFESQYPDNLKSPDVVTAWNQLCWYGTLFGEADLVAPFGAKAIKGAEALVPKLTDDRMAGYHDTRGLNLGVRGNYDEARAEFETYLKLVKDRKPPLESAMAKRREWVRQLGMKTNPFTPEVLKALKNE